MSEPIVVIMAGHGSDGDAMPGLPSLRLEQTVALRQAILLDNLALAEELAGITTAIAISSSADKQHVVEQVAFDTAVYVVDGPHIGARLKTVLARAFDERHSPVIVVIAERSPSPAPERIGQALSWFLQAQPPADVVLGPQQSGDLYLVGLARPQPELFSGIVWDAGDTLSQVLKNAERLGLTVQQLHHWHQISSVADLQHLRAELDSLPEHTVNLRRFLEEYD